MDSWTPLQLRMMHIGGNQRFMDFLQQHGISENTPIRTKYNTRAAEWYRRNLRAEAEGNEPPEALPEGTGHLPVSGAPSTTQIAFAKAAAGTGIVSTGGAF